MTRGGICMVFYGYTIESIKGHIEVYCDGKFQFSADTVTEAKHDIMELIN